MLSIMNFSFWLAQIRIRTSIIQRKKYFPFELARFCTQVLKTQIGNFSEMVKQNYKEKRVTGTSTYFE